MQDRASLRQIAIGLVVLGASGLAGWAVWTPGPVVWEHVVEEDARGASVESVAPEVHRGAGLEVLEDEESGVAVEPRRERVDESEGAAEAVERDRVEGSVAVDLCDGVREETLDGVLTLVVRRGEGGEPREVEVVVVEGEWEAEVEIDADVIPLRARLGGRPVVFPEHGPDVRRYFWNDLTGRFADVELQVVDASSGRDLDGVRVVTVPRDVHHVGHAVRLTPSDHPELETLVEGASSPVRVEGDPYSDAIVFVRAEGYAWFGGTEWDVLRCWSDALWLEPACDLRLSIGSPPLGVEAFVRVRVARAEIVASPLEDADKWMLVFDEPLGDQRLFTIEGLPPCEVEATVEVGVQGEPRGFVIAESRVSLSPGRTTTAILTCGRPPEIPDAVPLAGTLRIPIEWSARSASVSLRMIDPPWHAATTRAEVSSDAMIGSLDSGEVRWDAGAVVPGRYAACVRLEHGRTRNGSCLWHDVVDVPADGTSQARLEVPPPAELVIDARFPEQDPGHLAVLTVFGRKREFGSRLAGLHMSDPPPGILYVPAGGVVWVEALSTFATDGGETTAITSWRPVLARSGSQRVTINVSRGIACTIDLTTAEPTPILDRRLSQCVWGVQLRGVGHEGADSGSAPLDGAEGAGRTYYVSAPGAYDVEFPEVEGLLTPHTRRVHLRRGAAEHLRVEVSYRAGEAR